MNSPDRHRARKANHVTVGANVVLWVATTTIILFHPGHH